MTGIDVDVAALSETCTQALKEMFPDALGEDLKAGGDVLAADLKKEFDFSRHADQEDFDPDVARRLLAIFTENNAGDPSLPPEP
ncbi:MULTISPECIES: hypothetical protein [unclassified Streptomyces]|uniref:hypothetical protein n=1 Tax=unclassified Streptomyces TaxID=2593676 RepID=UPI001BEA79AB|nr:MULTISPECIES: hypothetical protein [unclassified Streptomyces]MBT2407258.1 hypothetical protein [Streptomyces sp. ISL-21]MBT2455634.1 hypothetical protein [Streptomyces sp. ISL-86]MBT2613496.1 hypothetical protein [Streptomyces sp. ISL-87]